LIKLNWLATNSPASYTPTHKRPYRVREGKWHKISRVQTNNHISKYNLFHKKFNKIYLVSYIAGNLLLKEALLQFNNLLEAAPELLAGLDQVGLCHGLLLLGNRRLQGVHTCVVRLTCPGLHDAPHRIVQRIEIRTRGRPGCFVQEVRHVSLKPFLGLFGSVRWRTILLPDVVFIRIVSFKSWQHFGLQEGQVGLGVDLDAFRKKYWRSPLAV
jgi:hypothetical protein